LIDKYYVYVLELEGGNFYIGQTKNFKRRSKSHECGSAAQWTELHKPSRPSEFDPTIYPNESAAAKRETELTLEYMKRFGWQKVRGGAYCSSDNAEVLYQLQAAGHFLDVPPIKRFDKTTGKELPGVLNFYAVAKGRSVGIFTEWYGPNGADKVVNRYPGALYKKFKIEADAEKWLAAASKSDSKQES
jgi:predicted GIY-YIG superfamily endonuclease